MAGRTNIRTTAMEDRATQLLISEKLSLAITSTFDGAELLNS